MSGEYMRKLMKIVTEDDINPKGYDGYSEPPPSAEELALQREATEQVAAKISEIFEKKTNAQNMSGARNLGNIPGHLYKLGTIQGERGEKLITAHFNIMVVYGEHAERNAENSALKVQALYDKLVKPLRGANFSADHWNDAPYHPRKNAWKDQTTSDGGGYTLEFEISAPSNIKKETLQKILSRLDSQA